MNSFFNLQFGEFQQATPNWFDWFSLLISLIINAASIFLAFYIAESIYNREKKDKEKEETDLQNSEIELFKINLIKLGEETEKQIINLKEAIREKNFKLTINQGVQAQFLQYIEIKYLYKNIGFENRESINKLNSLMSSLYSINDFRESISEELRTFMNKYSYHESKFYSYKLLLYSKYFSLCNHRAEEIIVVEGQKKWKFADNDKFMKEYSELIAKTFENLEIIHENGLKDRKKLIEQFVIPLIGIAYKNVPEDDEAIEINDIANEVNSAFIDMESVTEIFYKVIDSYLHNLESTNKKINEYLN